MASKLVKLTPQEAENQLELSLRQAFEVLEQKLRPPFALTIPNPQDYSNLNLAILYGVLSQPHLAKTHIKHLHGIVTDGYGFFCTLLVKVVNELYVKLVDSAKNQLVWVTKEMIDVLGVGFDGLLVCLLRQVVGGDFSDGNLWLCYELVSVFLGKWDCLLEEEPLVLVSALYVFLRLLADHCRSLSNAKLDALKRLETEFCVKMLREQFHLCLRMGRDLIRLLQDLVHVPEFRAIWKDLVLNPSEFRTQGFLDISQLYHSRTSSRYFLLRITPEMETQLRFLLTHVKFGSQKRYQAWFAKKFLLWPERETLIVDIVRFICCAHHPSNEIIQSDVVPRWAVIGWLLKSCRKSYVEANVKLALFYDWLFFDERVDNIMNIEPAMLLMAFSIPRYMDITHTLLEFLFLLMENYDVDRNDIIVKGISSAFSELVRKGVVHSMNVFTSCVALSPFLKDKLGRFLSDSNLGVPKELQTTYLPHLFVPPLSLPNMSCLRTPTPSSPKVQSACASEDASLPTSDKRFLSGSKRPRLSVPPLSLPNVSSLKTPTPSSKATGGASLPISDKKFLSGSKNPCVSVPPLSLPDASCLETSTPLPKGQPSCTTKDTRHVDVCVPILDALPSVISCESEIDPIESLFQCLGETIKKSNAMGLQTLEAILLSFVNLDNQRPGSSSACPEVLSSKIEKEFELNGYRLFSPLKYCDDETGSATALITRIFIFSQHERMQEMLLFWSKSGLPVGARLLSYVSRLAYEAYVSGYLGNVMIDNNSAKVRDSGMPLLIFHVDGYFSFLRGRTKDSHEDIVSTSNIDKKLVCKLVDSAFAAYRCFLIYSRTILHKEADTSLSKLLFSDLMSCSNWERKRLDRKFLFCSIFCHLSDISIGDEDIIRQLVSQLDHADLVSMQFDIGLKKYSIFGENTETILHIIKHSLNWDCLEQHKFWGLIRSELAVSTLQVEKIILKFFCSGDLDESFNAIAVGGLQTLCSCCAPTPELVGAIMLLPNNAFKDLSAAALATWVISNAPMLFDSLAKFSEKFDNKNGDSIFSNTAGIMINHSAVLWLLDYFNAQGMNGSDILSNFPVNIPEK